MYIAVLFQLLLGSERRIWCKHSAFPLRIPMWYTMPFIIIVRAFSLSLYPKALAETIYLVCKRLCEVYLFWYAVILQNKVIRRFFLQHFCDFFFFFYYLHINVWNVTTKPSWMSKHKTQWGEEGKLEEKNCSFCFRWHAISILFPHLSKSYLRHINFIFSRLDGSQRITSRHGTMELKRNGENNSVLLLIVMGASFSCWLKRGMRSL